MNRIYTFLLAFIPLLSFSQFEVNIVSGDTFQQAYIGEEIKVKMYVKNPNMSGQNMQLRWRLLNDFAGTSVPNWTNYVCEGTLCYSASTRAEDFNLELGQGDSVAIYTYIKMSADSGMATSCLSIFNPNDSAGTAQEICLTGHAIPDPAGVESFNIETVVLNQNVPNPFAESTKITFEMNKGGELKVHDLTGKLIKSIVVPVGERVVQLSGLDAGMYFYSLWSEGQVLATKRMMVVK